MCTVTFIARKRGYVLGMNRDEKLARAKGLAPAKRLTAGRAVLCPSESSGGTWIAANDFGVTFALINWYSIPTRAGANAVSRGEVIKAVCATGAADVAATALAELPLKRINPFRLIGVSPESEEIVEWRWDLRRLIRKKHRWASQQWISSGFDEPTAQRVRSKTFRLAGKQASAGSRDWLRRLHRSHAPEAGPCSTCMHRADAATVSYTEVTVSSQQAVMSYHAGPPCERARLEVRWLRLRK